LISVKLILQSGFTTRLKTLIILATLSIACILNSGCSSLPFFEQKSVEITYSSPDRISFQGKGAGAGIALMSSMGPVGIAIGVAIDEGIAQDIRENADNGGIDFKSIFQQAVRQTDQFQQAESIEVKQYGFVIKNGSKDYVAAEIQILVTQDGEIEQRILSSWPKQQELERWVTLDELKTDSDVIKELFLMALK
jgi:hypothetical protein